MSPLPEKLRPDCANCCGLCCVAPPFDADQGFGHDKSAHEPCHHLQRDFRCAIHDRLADSGYPGCAGFDCFGAGQRVTQQLYGSRDWSRNPEIATRMFDTYARVRSLHELMALAALARERVTGADRLALQELIMELDARCEQDLPVDTVQLRREIVQRLQQLV